MTGLPHLPQVVVVTGTGTGVGKTVATAALAAEGLAAGRRVAVVKPVQTGFAAGSTVDADGEHPDADEVRRLLGPVEGGGLTVHEYVRLDAPLAPQTAARLMGVALPPLKEHAERITGLLADHDLVLVEGAGGLLVRLDDDGGTIADLAALLPDAQVVVVTGAELGTLNVTELTVEALARRGVPVFGLLIGSWPADPGQAERSNLDELPRLTGVPLLGVVPRRPSLPPRVVMPPV